MCHRQKRTCSECEYKASAVTLGMDREWNASGAVVPLELTLLTFFIQDIGKKDMKEMPIRFGDNPMFRRVNSYHT